MRRLAVAAGLVAVAVAGCGQDRSPPASALPVAAGLRATFAREVCPVSPQQCFRWMILEPQGHTTERRALAAERAVLRRHRDPHAYVLVETSATWLRRERDALASDLRAKDTQPATAAMLAHRLAGEPALFVSLQKR